MSTPKHKVKPFEQRKVIKCSDPIKPIKKAALEFEITPNLQALANPITRPEPAGFEPYENPYEVPREYRKIKTVGYKALATPRSTRKRFVKGDNVSEKFEVSTNALKYKPTDVVKKLAEPKRDISQPPRAGFAVSKAALKKLKPDKEKYYAKLASPRKQ